MLPISACVCVDEERHSHTYTAQHSTNWMATIQSSFVFIIHFGVAFVYFVCFLILSSLAANIYAASFFAICNSRRCRHRWQAVSKPHFGWQRALSNSIYYFTFLLHTSYTISDFIGTPIYKRNERSRNNNKHINTNSRMVACVWCWLVRDKYILYIYVTVVWQNGASDIYIYI